MSGTRSYTPAAGHHFLTPFYDIGVRLSTRETVWRAALVELIAPKDSDVLLDIGAGTGNLAVLLAQKNHATRYFGIDPDGPTIAIARKKLGAANLAAEFLQAHFSAKAVAAWPAPSVATLCLVLHQVPLDEKRRLLREIHSVLQPGGRLYVADYAEQKTWLMRKLFRVTIQNLDGRADTQPNADGVLPLLMSDAGFSDVHESRQFDTVTGSISILCGMKQPTPD
ncbi:MAG: class I SAM-dependent methyltransferase [Novosphingobium sp.]|nr:class I SAM-dependent methyltransferase [Novosphingobium sp.]